MTNIWADLYKEIREPFFEMADPYAVTEEKKEKEEKGEKKHKEGKEEEESEKAGEDQEHKYTKKSGKKSKDYDGDGEVEDETDEYAGVKDRAIKKAMKMKEEVDEIDEKVNLQNQSSKRKSLGKYKGKYESPKEFRKTEIKDAPYQSKGNYNAHLTKEERDLFTKSDKNEKIDVRKGIHNKIDTKPSIPEEVEAWVDELLEEGYDLSDFTWDEVVEIYETAELGEADTTTMAPRGDAQTVNNTGADPLQAAKRRAAQAQVRKELSDLQVAKARASAKLAPASEEAILNYLENRYDLSEGVFDPKKTKLRSASERKSSELSPAQKKAAEMKQKRAERLESEAEKVLRQVRGGSAARRSSKPMGSEAPAAKAPAPEANRKLTGRQKSDTLAKKAGDVLKSLKK